jgi:hypothetical protein
MIETIVRQIKRTDSLQFCISEERFQTFLVFCSFSVRNSIEKYLQFFEIVKT